MKIEQIDFSHPQPSLSLSRSEQNYSWRMSNFTNAMLHYGVIDNVQGKTRMDPSKLHTISDTTELRILYGLSLPWTRSEHYVKGEQFGSIITHTTPYMHEEPMVIKDLYDREKSVTLKKGDKIGMIDFIPFTNLYGVPELALESMFIGNLDFARMLSAKRNTGDIPKMLEGSTNAVNAQFVTRHWNFRYIEALHIQKNHTIQPVTDKDEVMSLLKDAITRRSKPDPSLMFRVFVDTKDLYSDEFIAKLSTTAERLYERAYKTGKTHAKDAEVYERELRVQAIEMNMAQQKTLPPSSSLYLNDRGREVLHAFISGNEKRQEKGNSDKQKKKTKEAMRKKSQKRNRK